jgi:succinate-acetate transporter protein
MQALINMHRQAVFKLEGSQSTYILALSVFCGGWATIIAGFLHKDELVTQRAMKLGTTQLLLQCFVVGQIWAIFTALDIKRESSLVSIPEQVEGPMESSRMEF